MIQQLGNLSRTHTCGALRASDVGSDIVLLGWVHRVRDLGGLLFFDVRDRHGMTQVVARAGGVLEAASQLRPEYVVAIEGRVELRDAKSANPKMPTGDIEVVATGIRLLNEAKTPPFPITDETNVGEDMRLRYRYLDLRRPKMQRNLELRHKIVLATRNYFDRQGFVEIETPILTRSTPEGARDYLVPSRVHPGEFFALPQSPQIFKQILMVAGMDRYFQIVKCFRDEDLRADRQPEFTQIDVELSFATEELVFSIVEGVTREIFAAAGRDIQTPFARVSYDDAMHTYGSDKPDLRAGMPIADISDVFRESSFSVFKDAVAGGGVVRAIAVPGASGFSRKDIDELVEQAKQAGASGLVWARRSAEGAVQSSALKAAGEETIGKALDAARAEKADLVLMASGEAEASSKVLGALRLSLAKKLGLLDPNLYAFTWVVDFPLLEYNEGEGRWFSMHHPFTSPKAEDLGKLESEPGAVRARAYDLALNGSEIAGGSIRIHDPELQRRVFRRLGIDDEEARARFGFFLDALEYGTPPHGGIAFGVDRMCAILAGEDSIREVMAFPKTASATDLMAGAPSVVDAKQLKELHIKVDQG